MFPNYILLFSELDANILVSIMLYCRKRNYNKTAFDIDQMTDLSQFSRFLNIERFAEDKNRSKKPSLQHARTTSDRKNFKRKLNSKLLKTRSRNKSKESSEKLLTSPDTKAEQSLRPEEKNERLSTGKIQKILKSKNCTIGKLIEYLEQLFKFPAGLRVPLI